MFTEEALEINKNVSASISTFYDDEGEQYFFQNFNRWNIWMEILFLFRNGRICWNYTFWAYYSTFKSFSMRIVSPNQVFLSIWIDKFKVYFMYELIHGQMRRPEKSSKSAVDDNFISEDDFDSSYPGDQAEDD